MKERMHLKQYIKPKVNSSDNLFEIPEHDGKNAN